MCVERTKERESNARTDADSDLGFKKKKMRVECDYLLCFFGGSCSTDDLIFKHLVGCSECTIVQH